MQSRDPIGQVYGPQRSHEVHGTCNRKLSLSSGQASAAFSLVGIRTVTCCPTLCVPEDITQSKMFISEITDFCEKSTYQRITIIFIKSLVTVFRNAISPRQRTCKAAKTKTTNTLSVSGFRGAEGILCPRDGFPMPFPKHHELTLAMALRTPRHLRAQV